MKIESGFGQEMAPSLVDQNRQRIARIIDEEIAEWQMTIDSGDGSADHHAAEARLLAEMGGRVDYLVGPVYSIEEPVDATFVHDLIDFLKATDYSRDAWPEESITRESEVAAVDEAVESLRRRNVGLAEAA